MEEQSNRKVLISIKVSTLLLILISIILIVTVSTIIFSKVKNEKVSNVEYIDTNDEEVALEDAGSRITNLTITSRSSDSRTEETSEENETNDEENILENIENQETNIALVENLTNGVGGIEIESEPEEPATTPISEVTIAKDMDLTIRTGLSREDFITLMAGVKQDTSGFFEENAGLIYDTCEKYSLNEIFFCGLISAESGWDIASNHRRTYNYISLMSGSGLIKFASVEDGIEKAAQTLHDKYLTPGGSFYYGSTLAGMKTKFCPASSTWVNLVYQRMQQILNNR